MTVLNTSSSELASLPTPYHQKIIQGIPIPDRPMTFGEWVVIEDCPEYIVHPKGIVVSYRIPDKPREIKGSHRDYKGSGYKRFHPYNSEGKKVKKKYFHIVVAHYFIGPKQSTELEVCHRDDDLSNNDVENLYYGSTEQNARDRVFNGRVPDKFLSAEETLEMYCKLHFHNWTFQDACEEWNRGTRQTHNVFHSKIKKHRWILEKYINGLPTLKD